MPGGLAAGQLVDERYALDEPLAEDSLGTVWRAYDRGLQRDVVLRDVHFPGGAFRDEPGLLQEALGTARAAIRLDHPGAIHVYDAFVDGDHLVLVTELFAGRSLATMVERKGALPPKRVAAIGLDLLAPLEALHALGLAHGALAPTSVVVPEKGPARLTELGLAPSFTDAKGVAWAHAAGTPTCLAPEQLRHEGNGAAADMWGLGATLYYAVEGTHAFSSVDAIASGPLRPPSRAGTALGAVLERLLAPSPADRPSPAELRAELTAIAGVLAVDGDGGGRRSRRRRPRDAAPAPDVTLEAFDGDGAPEATVEVADRDWAAVVTGERAPALAVTEPQSEPGWQDWSPGEVPADTSDTWLPAATATTASTEGGGPAGDTPELTVDPSPPAMDSTMLHNADAATSATDAVPVAVEEDEARRYRATPSWPPPDARRGPVVVGLCFLVMVVLVALLVTNGRIGGGEGSGTTVPAAQRPVLATDPSSVPRDWITYRHARADMGISHPASWVVSEEGQAVIIRDPATAAELRIDYQRSPDVDPHQSLLGAEGDFSARHRADYRRLQLSPASFLGEVAALWEYTYSEGPVELHAVDLRFHSADTELILAFRAAAGDWEAMLPMFHSFLSSIRPPR